MSKKPNPYLEVLKERGIYYFILALKSDPLQTSALKAAIVSLEAHMRSGL